MVKKAKAKKQFPSLSYYTINRAAKALGCKARDILHWGADGKIRVMVNLDQWTTSVYGVVQDISNQSPDDDGTVILSGGSAFYSEIEPIDNEKEVLARLGGIWSVLPSSLYECYMGLPMETPQLFAPTDAFVTSSTTEALAGVTEMDNPFPTFFISRDDFERLEKLIAFDEPALHEKATESDELVAALAVQVAELRKELGQVEAQNSDLVNQLQQAGDEITTLKAKAPTFRYLTPLLELVAEVQERYWGDNWDRDNPDSNPRQEDVIEWVKKGPLCKASRKRAEMVAVVARPAD